MGKIDEDSPDCELINSKVSEASYRYEDLRDRLREREDELKQEIENSQKFADKVEELEAWLETAGEELASQGPISTDPVAVQQQLEQVQVRGGQAEEAKLAVHQ